MKMLWCWRCKTEMPMLDDDEFRQVMSLLPKGKPDIRTREDYHAMFAPMLAELRTDHWIPCDKPQRRVPPFSRAIWTTLSVLREAIEDSACETLRQLHEARCPSLLKSGPLKITAKARM
jgi:hypothetical protein